MSVLPWCEGEVLSVIPWGEGEVLSVHPGEVGTVCATLEWGGAACAPFGRCGVVLSVFPWGEGEVLPTLPWCACVCVCVCVGGCLCSLLRQALSVLPRDVCCLCFIGVKGVLSALPCQG